MVEAPTALRRTKAAAFNLNKKISKRLGECLVKGTRRFVSLQGLKVVISKRTVVATFAQATLLETGATSRKDTNHSFQAFRSVLFHLGQF